MKKIATLLALLLATLMLLSGVAFARDNAYTLGGKMDDFTVTTWDGQTITLSALLEEKDMVLINIWATWCPPCRNEFPHMEEAYQQYAEDVAIVALSCEASDTDDVLAQFVADMGLSFHVARDTVGMSAKLQASSIPTTVVVDRFGNICFWETGSLPDVGSFTRLFDAFVGEDYTQSLVLQDIPPMKPDVAPVDEALLAAALEVPAVRNVTGVYAWPMLVAEKDGRTVMASSNAGVDQSAAAVEVPLTAHADDAIVITFKTSTEAACDVLSIAINGETVKNFAGEHDWMTYAIPVEADGECTLTLTYDKDALAARGEDAIWVDSVAVVSGDDAAAALAANPVHPVADVTELTIINEGAQEITFDDPNNLLQSAFGDAKYYITNSDTAIVHAAVTADVDPEAAMFVSYYDFSSQALTNSLTDAGYTFATGVDALETTGYSSCYVLLYLDLAGNAAETVVYFRDEANANYFAASNMLGNWYYVDGGQPGDAVIPEKAAPTASQSTYTISYTDQDGNPVPGVMVQVCDAATCQVYTTDENGVVSFTAAPYAWEIHTLMLPAGYEGDTETVTLAPAEGGEMAFTVTRQ